MRLQGIMAFDRIEAPTEALASLADRFRAALQGERPPEPGGGAPINGPNADAVDQGKLIPLLECLLTDLKGQPGTPSDPMAAPSRKAVDSTPNPEPSPAAPLPDPATTPAPSTAAGQGPNQIVITNTQDHAITLGKFKNGESTTDPSAAITLQPGQTGTLSYADGEAGFVAQADATGAFQPNASRLEYEADADGKMKYPDVSYIDGRNASISLTDGAGLNKGDKNSIAAGAPAGTVTTDAAGNKTIAGWYDGSTATMQAGGAFMQAELGTGGAYLHPNDDTLAAGQNPMSGTKSTTLEVTFGAA